MLNIFQGLQYVRNKKKTVTAARLRQKKCLPKKVLFEKKMVDTLTHMQVRIYVRRCSMYVSVCKTNALARQFEGWSVRAKLTHHAKCRGHQIRNVIIYLVNNWLNSFLKEHSYFHSIMRFHQKLLNFHTFVVVCLFHIKAMKSSYLLWPFWDLKFWRFSLLKIKTG